MAGLVRQDIGLREAAGLARAATEARLDLAEESRIDEDLPVGRAIERAHRALRHAAAAAIGGVAEQNEPRAAIILVAGLEDLGPAVVDLAEHAGHEGAHLVGGRPTPAITRDTAIRADRTVHLLRLGAAAIDHLSAANQNAGIDAERPADQPEHDNRTDAEPAATAHRYAETASAAAKAATAFVVTAVIDVVAAAKIIPAHCTLRSCPRPGDDFPEIRACLPINSVPGKYCLVGTSARFGHASGVLPPRALTFGRRDGSATATTLCTDFVARRTQNVRRSRIVWHSRVDAFASNDARI